VETKCDRPRVCPLLPVWWALSFLTSSLVFSATHDVIDRSNLLAGTPGLLSSVPVWGLWGFFFGVFFFLFWVGVVGVFGLFSGGFRLWVFLVAGLGGFFGLFCSGVVGLVWCAIPR